MSLAWDVPCLVDSYFAKTDRPHSRDISSVPFFNRFPSFSLWLNTIPNLFHHQLPSSHLTVSHTTISITNSTDEAHLCYITRCNENIGLYCIFVGFCKSCWLRPQQRTCHFLRPCNTFTFYPTATPPVEMGRKRRYKCNYLHHHPILQTRKIRVKLNCKSIS